MRKGLLAIGCWLLALLFSVRVGAVPFQERVLLYPSVDQHGDSLILSGRISVPEDQPAKGIILVPHYTITALEESPSIKITGDAKYYQDEYVVIVPDFIGYGVTGDRVHPYLHGELTARNCVDMVLAAQPILDSMALGIPLDSLYIVGFSQGGATAVWTLKLLEEEYADRLHVIQCYAGGGPYDVAVTYDHTIKEGHIFMPSVIPMLVVGTDVAYDLHLNYADFFTSPMQKAYRKYIANKQYGVVPLFFKLTNHRVKHWLTKQARDKSDPETWRLYQAFQRSSLVTDSVCPSWTPQAPLYVFHSTKDNVVTIECAEHFRRCYPDAPNITYDIQDYGSHMKSSYIFYRKVRELLDASSLTH